MRRRQHGLSQEPWCGWGEGLVAGHHDDDGEIPVLCEGGYQGMVTMPKPTMDRVVEMHTSIPSCPCKA